MPPPTLRGLEERLGLPRLTDMTTLLTGENSKRINLLLGRLEKLSQDNQAIRDAKELLEIVERLNHSGGLDKLNQILGKLPRGKSQQTLMMELNKMLDGLDAKIDKLTKLASTILEKED